MLLVAGAALVQSASAQMPRLDAIRGTSKSGAFIVYSPDRKMRLKLISLADAARQEWVRIVETKSNPPIIIVDKSGDVRPRGSSGVSTLIFEGDGGEMKVQVNLYDAAEVRNGNFQSEVVRALALQSMHRKNPPRAGASFSLPPYWFIEGLGEEMRRKSGTVPDGLHAALVRSDRPPTLKEFLSQKTERLDATSLLLYRAQALALLQVILKTPDSKKRLLEFMESPDFSDSKPEQLLAAFPALQDAAHLTKLWTLEIARGTLPPRMASLSVEKTNNELMTILAFNAPSNPKKKESPVVSGPLAMPLAARSEGGAFLMRQRSVELLNLEFRGHPLLRPIIEEYRNIATQLAIKPKAKVESRIEETDKIRALLVERHKRITDYLNWYEATQIDISDKSLLEETTAPPVPPRRDPLSRYLDSIEARGW